MAEKPRGFRVVFRILKELRERKTLAFLLVLSIVTAGLDISVPVIIQKSIDAFVQSISSRAVLPFSYLVFASLAILVATLSSRTLRNVFDYHLFQYVTKLEELFRHRGYEKYLYLHALYHHSQSSGQAIGRIDRGAAGIYAIVHDIIGQNLFIPVVYFAAIIGFLVLKNPIIAAIVFLPLPLYLIFVRGFAEKIYEIDRQTFERFDAASKEQYDVASNAMTVKRFAQEEREVGHLRKLREEARDIQYGAERLWVKIDVLQTAIGTAGRVLVFIVAGLYVIQGKATVGEFMLFMTLQNMVYQPMFQLSVLFPRLRRNIARVEKMFEIIDTPVEITDSSDAKTLPPLNREIRFKNVRFKYGENLPYVLKNVDVVIPSGKITALVGKSGSGKTTFVNLLMRAYDPTGGTILIDGVDIKTVTQKSLRGQIAIVPQEVDLFSRSIAENICYGSPGATDGKIREAARLALASEFIEQFEDGYDTVVGERGIKLSGGERQRVGIARAVLKDPSILILDEATSHLDTVSERLVQEATDTVMRNRTTIVIAHRFSTVLRADQIIVFDHGMIETVGRHQDLLRKSFTYRKLYELQFAI